MGRKSLATVSLNDEFDFLNTPWWTTFYARGSDSDIFLEQPGLTAFFHGSFDYDGDLDVTGTVRSFSLNAYYSDPEGYARGGSYSYVGEPLDAAKIRNFVLTLDGAQAFHAFVLKGDDRFENVSGGVILGYGGNDVFLGTLVRGTVNGGSGTDTYVAPPEHVTFDVRVGISADLSTGRVTSMDRTWKESARLISVENLVGSSGNDLLGGTAAANRLDGRAGVDTASYASASASVRLDLGLGSASGGGGADVLVSIENANGGKAADVLIGSAAANVLNGGAGADTLRGGLGDDTYVVDQSGDVLIESAGAGIDTVQSAIGLTLGSAFENLLLLGTAHLSGQGNAVANRLIGNAGNNQLDGAAGADRLEGGSGADRLRGGPEADLLLGAAGNDTLDGGLGNDVMSGGSGDDVYVVDSTSDRLMEDYEAGRDLVLASVSVALPVHVEDLTLTGSANAAATGNGAANVLRGNAGSNVLNGSGGADGMIGGAGNDRYIVDNVADRCYEAAGGGVDTVQATVAYTLGDHIENLILSGSAAIAGTGNALANQIFGNAAGNVLTGGQGNDTMAGGAGNDVYVVDAVGDVIRELAGQGVDTVRASVSLTLSSEVEKAILTGSASLQASGNALANTLTGNSAGNRLDGGTGADLMIGGLGDDIYVVDVAGDIAFEAEDQGTDLVISSASYVLRDHVENLTLTGSAAIHATGNGLANRLVGNAAANVLSGGEYTGAADTLIGGAGDDVYRITTFDSIVETPGGGTDTAMVSAPSWWYYMPAHVENAMVVDQFGIYECRLAGNALANRLTGGAHADRLNGGAGNDTMIGGAGHDSYDVDSAGDVVIEESGGGYDEVIATIDYTAAAGIEQIVLSAPFFLDLNATGNGLNNTLFGNSGDNVLDGAAGNDILRGGNGADTYIVDSAGDRAYDSGTDDAIDTVRTSVDFDLASGEGLENLVLTGVGHVNGRGTAERNVLSGNGGDNLLDGRAGVDTVSYADATSGVFIDLGAGIATGFGSDILLGFENVIGSSSADTLRGDDARNGLHGGAGADRFVIDSAATDTVADFATGVDTLAISQHTLAIGNGDLQIDGAVTVSGPGGFDAAAELVIMQNMVAGSLDATVAAAAIGEASSPYASGQSALFAVHGPVGVGVYRFTSVNDDAAVDSAELTLLASLQSGSSVADGDFLWVA